MKLITDNAFSKAWKKECPTCKNDRLWYRERCHECEMQKLEVAKKLIKYGNTKT